MNDKNAITGGDPPPKRFLPSIATMSLGSTTHPLNTKLEVAALKGFRGIELYWDDLAQYSLSRVAQTPSPPELISDTILEAASEIAKLAKSLRLKIVSLQPFRNFDGLINRKLRKRRLEEFQVWLAVAHILGTDIIGVPSTLPTVNKADYTGDRFAAAADLKFLVKLAKRCGIRIAYENLCFGEHVKDWKQAWDRIKIARSPENLLFLPDTFNICGRTYMDPEEESGKQPNADSDLRDSLKMLVDKVPMSRMPLLQIADAEALDLPLTEDHPWRKETGLGPLMALSRNARVFPFEKKGYLPVLSVVQALVDAGWEGWLSMEVFSRTTNVEGEATILEHADRAWASWETLAGSMGWDARPKIKERI